MNSEITVSAHVRGSHSELFILHQKVEDLSSETAETATGWPLGKVSQCLLSLGCRVLDTLGIKSPDFLFKIQVKQKTKAFLLQVRDENNKKVVLLCETFNSVFYWKICIFKTIIFCVYKLGFLCLLKKSLNITIAAIDNYVYFIINTFKGFLLLEELPSNHLLFLPNSSFPGQKGHKNIFLW